MGMNPLGEKTRRELFIYEFMQMQISCAHRTQMQHGNLSGSGFVLVFILGT